ncbi:MAG: hypothetical protein A2268_14925 [Candidatus Raymondbacteria bacterium RifOxyA12_full_50_37]|uniref:DUF5723 domain-containing protein n=1 Tax=Candidatus Raymondbacteria bacterium RIFOXYD12_FULL_49_13 TaxID=1817890 RepID=A0A1F7F2J1_UNCRA|nr:MAG: hypothetical protein A2268_14925 [Candidatus Raymondbacteria bacterium RifOxyA12_full_50_37]OGJ88708.1 MAG: hypothetical protein A2248_20860 [Candidatus Raymondbacteria bacterium RIFOXYA2_FULL_49_16]OGJ94484.1 MAG: hypothetical protein A2487_16715 [Candidatus Raymondbacteria bacterium RifOxyC12_full_50_8]OGK00879.1 MAG: hypothetical protein A2519_08120 [Candidatus Raymondbacteria bacterium RIFOXYD12_FULL_49_13]OGP41745.1 MAG: hypothetical protein A2324_07950 [Candidatus Raymondbacteria 
MGIQKKFLLLLLAWGAPMAFSQSLDLSLNAEQSRAILEGGISYDILRYPTDVSFDYPEGHLSFNVPLDLTTSQFEMPLEGVDSSFAPRIGARQKVNFSFRINVPMLGGVVSYSQTENVNFGFNMNLGSIIGMDTVTPMEDMGNLTLSLKGAINAPIRYRMGWRTQTFGYAFKPTKNMVLAFNLHKHLFELDANGIVNTNILGNVGIDISNPAISKDLGINYSENDVFGQVRGNFSGSAWSPAFGLKWWRLTATARLGVNTKVKGHFLMKWKLPFFIDPNPKSFKVEEDQLLITDIPQDDSGNVNVSELMNKMQTLEGKLDRAETDSFKIDTKTDLEFSIPSGYTLSFDLIRDHLSFSYTYVRGAISAYHQDEQGVTDLNLGFEVNHVMLMNLSLFRANLTVGAFVIDFYEMNKKNWLSESAGIDILGGVPVPVLNLSTTIGGAARILLELDILPIPAGKTGIVYYF